MTPTSRQPQSGDETAPLSPSVEPGAIVWGARLVRPLARGGMAELWLAERLESGGEVVIKFLATPVGEDDPDWIDQAVERFRLEAQIAEQLGAQTRHIVQVHAAGQLGDTPYLVMEHVPGRSLEAILGEKKRLAPEAFASLLDQIAEALGVAHAANVVHRDVKPANLLVTGEITGPGSPPVEGERGPFVQLADFGVAKAKRSSLMVDLPKDTSSALVVGSPAYASPEQLYQQELDGRSDLWSLGVVAYEALTGALPFGSSVSGKATPELIVAVCTAGFERASKTNRALPRTLDAWFDKALAKDRTARFQSAGEMAAAFRQALVVAATRRTLIGVAGLALLMILGIAAALALR
jgi:eukaryotic-like serine/threonine-protein kinase